MKNGPTMEQWAELYEIAEKIKQLAPWKGMWDSYIVTLMLPGREEPVFCSVMGRLGSCYGVCVYPGYEAIQGYYRMADAPEGEPPAINFGLQNCLTCYYGDRDELDPSERETIKKLGLKFRGHNQWTYFRSMQTGHYPWFIDAEQADLLIQALKNLFMACRAYLEENLSVGFENGETLVRLYSEDDQLWLNFAAEMPGLPVDNSVLVLTDELLIAKLKKQKKTKMKLEMELIYLPIVIQAHKGDKPVLPQVAMLADVDSMFVFANEMVEPDERAEDVVLDIIVNHILDIGRPASIRVRDTRAGRILMDLCEKTDIKLIMGEGMPVMDELIDDLLKFIK